MSSVNTARGGLWGALPREADSRHRKQLAESLVAGRRGGQELGGTASKTYLGGREPRPRGQ